MYGGQWRRTAQVVLLGVVGLHANHEPVEPVSRRKHHTPEDPVERGTDYDRTLILAASTATSTVQTFGSW
jgi:hypothetical protein